MTATRPPAGVEAEAGDKRAVGLKIVLCLLLVALIGHWLYHYRPRVRSLPVGKASRLEDLWESPEARIAFWLAYPHQNLAELESRVGDLDAYLSDLGTVIGEETLRLPSFGPFRFPPASELVVTNTTSEPRWRGAAEIYPVVALAARGAGRLTGNPWLAGGVVGDAPERVVVSWHGRRWQLGSIRPGSVSRASIRDAAEGVVVARLRAVENLGRWPAGNYDLTVNGEEICLRPRDLRSKDLRSPLGRWMNDAQAPRVPLVTREVTPDGERAMLLFETPNAGLPGAVVLARGAGRWRLPGERLLTRLGAEVMEGTEGDWSLAAYSPEDLAKARGLLPRFAAADGPVGWSATVAAGPASRLSAGIGRMLAEIPLVGENESRPWLSLARLLAPLGETGVVEVSLGDPVFVRLRSAAPHQ